MSIAAQARSSRIDNEASRLVSEALRVNSQLATLVNEAFAYAAFMHTDPKSEFTQEDRDKYSADFAAVFQALSTTMAGLAPMAQLQAEAITVEQFLALYAGDITAYSSRFDKN